MPTSPGALHETLGSFAAPPFSIGIKNRGGANSEDDFSTSANIKGVKLRARATGELATKVLDLSATLKKASATTKTVTPDNTVQP